jgi:cell division protease FtsH
MATIAPIPQAETLTRQPSKRVRRKRRTRAIARFLRRVIPLLIIGGVVYQAVTDRAFLNFLLVAFGFIFQLLFAIMFILIQFIALFWFLSKSKVEIIRPGDPKQVTFDDYKGQPKLLELVQQWISLMSDREKFTQMGGNFINGILLYGPPGTGKTLLAKAMAGEADIAFISIEGSGFRAMFIGIDVLKMMQFTNRAKKLAREYGACIAYIDEIDAVAASRGAVMGGGNNGTGSLPAPRSPGIMPAMMGGMMGGGTGALTRLLTVMDGIDEPTRGEKRRNKIRKLLGKPPLKRDWHVLYMGSTNRPDVLDPALTRPGRFDRLIQVDVPDRTGRRAIIEYYLDKIQHDDTIDVEALVRDTTGYTPASLMAAITKGAVRTAVFDSRDKVSQSDIDRALQEQAGGMENPIEEMPEDQRRQIAYHEAGHAVAFYHLMPNRRLVRATIIRSGRALGHVRAVEEQETYAKPLQEYVANIMVSMAGHVATKAFLGEYWTGASSDFRMVRAYISGLMTYGYFGPPIIDPQQMFTPGAAVEGEPFDHVWRRVEKFWADTEVQVESFVASHEAEVEAVAHALLTRESLSGKELREIISRAEEAARGQGEQPQEPMVEELNPAEIMADLISGTDPNRASTGSEEASPSGD